MAAFQVITEALVLRIGPESVPVGNWPEEEKAQAGELAPNLISISNEASPQTDEHVPGEQNANKT
jgi:hypothetical protein